MKIVCFADTHASERDLKLPKGDVLVFAGDFSGMSTTVDLIRFNMFLRSQPHKHKILIAGNHETQIERDSSLVNTLFDNCIYLQDNEVTIDGIRFYGSPWTPPFLQWAFMKTEKELAEVWKRIPKGIHVLITHGPPDGILDSCKGSEALIDAVKRVQPEYHVFGHIHEGYGKEKVGYTTYINCSVLNFQYEQVNKPIVVEV